MSGDAARIASSGPPVRREREAVSEETRPPEENPSGSPPPRGRRRKPARPAFAGAARGPVRTVPVPRMPVLGIGLLLVFVGAVAAILSWISGKDPGDLLHEPDAPAAAADDARSTKARAEAEALFGPEIWDAKDGTDILDEGPLFRKVVEVVGSMDPKEVADRVEFSMNLHYADLMAHPERYRGRFLRMRGIVPPNSFGATKLDVPLAGRIDVYRGGLSDPSDSEPVIFFTLDRPETEFREFWDGVQVDGVFLRVAEYQSRTGKMVKVPVLVARTVVLSESARSKVPVAVGLAVMTAFLAIVFGIVYLVNRGRSARPAAGMPGSFRAMLERDLRDEQRRREPPPPAGGA